MNEMLILNWNSVVKPQDKVYHLGDVTFDYTDQFKLLWSRLNGKKRLILGNHDKLGGLHGGKVRFFEKIEMWKGFKDENFTCTHVPYRLDSIRDGKFNVHGHTHNHWLDDPHYINVCVDVRGFTPVNMDTILAEIKRCK